MHAPLAGARVSVVVLGDIGRSPRMQYHARALVEALATVDLVGYAATEPHRSVRDDPRLTCHFLSPPRSARHPETSRLGFLGSALFRVLGQGMKLLWMLLFRIEPPRVILVQNPPAIPTLLVGWIAARARRAKLVIDWHNFGYAMLALKLGRNHPAVGVARWYERAVGRRADAHLCVSQAMQSELAHRWGITAVVLYDRPAAMFAPTAPGVRQPLCERLRETLALPAPHPVLIVSPSSWTLDEDFSVLLDAAVRCDDLIRRHDAAGSRPFPHLLFLLTGQGPLRAHYQQAIQSLTLSKVHLRTLWLSADDYPLVLGAADLGLCLHRSASGVDLPMKVADMFGAGLPVCALDYRPALAERVRHDENGLIFSTAAQLATQLFELFKNFPDDTPILDRLRRNVVETQELQWDAGWKNEALPLFARL
ncbi:MAG: glycosyltransferase [Candidatus Binatia bacterium]